MELFRNTQKNSTKQGYELQISKINLLIFIEIFKHWIKFNALSIKLIVKSCKSCILENLES